MEQNIVEEVNEDDNNDDNNGKDSFLEECGVEVWLRKRRKWFISCLILNFFFLGVNNNNGNCVENDVDMNF